MNVYEAMRRVLEYAIDYLDILPDTAASNEDVVAVRQMLAAYDALAPDWDESPDNAVWCAIHANGLQYWFDAEPVTTDGYNGWHNRSAWNDFYREMELPLGIDWRLCKWQRPEVTK